MRNTNDEFERKTWKVNGQEISVLVPRRTISWEEFVRETQPIFKRWIKRKEQMEKKRKRVFR